MVNLLVDSVMAGVLLDECIPTAFRDAFLCFIDLRFLGCVTVASGIFAASKPIIARHRAIACDPGHIDKL